MTGMVDVALSDEIRRRIRPIPRGCFRNAAIGLGYLCVTDWRARYVEGWALMSCAPLLTEHAWIVLSDGRIVEPTAYYYSAYFPVVAISIRRARALASAERLPRFGRPSRSFLRQSMRVYRRALESIGTPGAEARCDG